MPARTLVLLALALALPVAAAPAIDDAREDRWASEVVPAIVVGDAVWLATPSRAKVLAILTLPARPPTAGVIVVHGLGVHPDYGMIGGLRTLLADSGYATLAVQMPVLPLLPIGREGCCRVPSAGCLGVVCGLLSTHFPSVWASLRHSRQAF